MLDVNCLDEKSTKTHSLMAIRNSPVGHPTKKQHVIPKPMSTRFLQHKCGSCSAKSIGILFNAGATTLIVTAKMVKQLCKTTLGSMLGGCCVKWTF